MAIPAISVDLHKVVLEELLQLPLRGRIREVPDIKPPTLSRTLNDSLVLRSVAKFVSSSTNGGAFSFGSVFVEGGVCHLGGGTVDGSCGHFVGFWQ